MVAKENNEVKKNEVVDNVSQTPYPSTVEELAPDLGFKVVEDNPDYDIIKYNQSGKLRKRTKFHQYSSIKATTREEKVKLFNIMNGDDTSVISFKTLTNGTKIKITDIIFNPYTAVDKETNEFKRNVNTVIFDDKGGIFATSSKNVYFTLTNAFKVFGFPSDEDYLPITIEVNRVKREKGEQINIRLV